MTIPVGTKPELAAYLDELEGRIAALENPASPSKLFACLEADLPDPAAFYWCALIVTDLNIIAHSDGTDWRRQDTGAAI